MTRDVTVFMMRFEEAGALEELTRPAAHLTTAAISAVETSVSQHQPGNLDEAGGAHLADVVSSSSTVVSTRVVKHVTSRRTGRKAYVLGVIVGIRVIEIQQLSREWIVNLGRPFRDLPQDSKGRGIK